MPQGCGDGGGVGRIAFVFQRSVLFARQELVEPFGVDFAAKKIGFGENSAEEAGIRLDSGDNVFVERAAQAGNGFFA